MRPLQRIVFIVSCSFLIYLGIRLRAGGYAPGSPAPPSFPGDKGPTQQSFGNLSWTQAQCAAAFPGLFDEIEDAVSRGPFPLTWPRLGEPLQGRIKDNQLYILNWQKKEFLSQQMLNERTAALNQLYRAIVTSPEPLPDTVFALNIQDRPMAQSWSYARPADPTATKAGSFLMPHFAFWAWPLKYIGSMHRALTAITEIETKQTFQAKIPQAVWRGTPWFNDVQNHDLRKRLIRVTTGKPWADVQSLKWETNGQTASNGLAIEDFCRYKYIIYTEGVTYSGRLLFHQACRSIILTPPMAWMLHTTHLVRPVFSSALLQTTPSWGPPNQSDRIQRAWPTDLSTEDANLVMVSPDWSDLEATIAWLEDHPTMAEGIADRQRQLFHDGGYHSPAAEACYWRALIRGWSKVAEPEGREWSEHEGVRWELFSLGGL
ncbi:hypothetical protein LV164_008173 [Aspergillus fumigatus]|nr:hypothetical protein KXX42_008869 [Aspergillus fumigatus]KAH1604274.1 hypothetical protein KXX44_002883 [Aspergillus fumigatus]KAH1628852.1 hypothetical protein KXX39_004198 [Aspergillus fumigatus]KAH1977929.1 hypothetical protein KXW88_008202 [Aspergillus fumigatus]KAH2311655.1 hypothetical protein KXV47_004390 [Aspergillus fumigatus]